MDTDLCEVCDDPGRLVVCDRCQGTWHRRCHPIEITNNEMIEGIVWICHRCKREPLLKTNPNLTHFGHLEECFGRNRPNILQPSCCGLNERGQVCADLASKQACIFYDEKTNKMNSWCPRHWRLHCISMGYDSDLSKCANIMATRRGLSFADRINIDQYNLTEKLSLPRFHIDPELNNMVCAGHLSRFRLQAGNRRKRAEKLAQHPRMIENVQQNIEYESSSIEWDDSEDEDFKQCQINIDLSEENFTQCQINIDLSEDEDFTQSPIIIDLSDSEDSLYDSSDEPPMKRTRFN